MYVLVLPLAGLARLLLLLYVCDAWFQLPAQFVENLLEVHSKFSALIRDVFNNDQQLVGAMDKACSAAINYRPNPKLHCKSPEIVRSTHWLLLTILCLSNQGLCYYVEVAKYRDSMSRWPSTVMCSRWLNTVMLCLGG